MIKKSTAMAESELMLLTVVLCYALQELRPSSLHQGSLQQTRRHTGLPFVCVS